MLDDDTTTVETTEAPETAPVGPAKRPARKAAAKKAAAPKAPKTRVSDLAKQHGITSKEAIARLAELGEVVKSASSSVEADVVARFAEAYGAPAEVEAGPVEAEAPAEESLAKPAIAPLFQAPAAVPAKRTAKKAAPAPAAEEPEPEPQPAAVEAESDEAAEAEAGAETEEGGEGAPRRRRRRGGRRRRKPSAGGEASDEDESEEEAEVSASATAGEEGEGGTTRRRRVRARAGEQREVSTDEHTVVKVRKGRSVEDEITGFSGSTRLEAKKQRRREGREAGRRRAPIVTEAEFLARRESVDRVMVVRQQAELTQIAVLEDKVLVEHYVARESQTSLIGNVYLGRVQNVLPSMEAAFVDIGKGRNAVLYAGEVNWEAFGVKDGRDRKIEAVLKSGQTVLVQVTKDPIGHKGARLTSQISLPGRFLVYVPDGTTSGISRKLPDTERNRLKTLLKEIVPDSAGVIVRTAAEGASEDELTKDVERLKARWEDISAKVAGGNAPQLLYGEPDLTLKVVRDLFTEDFSKLVVAGADAWESVSQYVEHVAPDLAERLERFESDGDAFAAYRIDEQIAKGLDRKVWLPSGGSLIIDRTEAMTVVDVNTGKFTGSGGNLEETVTKNNLEAAEEVVRQLRLRDIGGIVVIDFIDMVLESNRDLVLRRLVECLGRDRTRHQVAEVTSLGLVQMTRKRIGTGLLEAFSETCEHCGGRGVVVHHHPVEPKKQPAEEEPRRSRRSRRGRGGETIEAPEAPVPHIPSPADIAAMPRHELAGGEDDYEDSALLDEDLTLDAADDLAETDLDTEIEGGEGEEHFEPFHGSKEEESEPLEEEPAPAVTTVVTRVRRSGARREAGPPASVVVPEEPADPPADPLAEGLEGEAEEAPVHVPVKKRGVRKR